LLLGLFLKLLKRDLAHFVALDNAVPDERLKSDRVAKKLLFLALEELRVSAHASHVKSLLDSNPECIMNFVVDL